MLQCKSAALERFKVSALAIAVCEDRAIHTAPTVAGLIEKALAVPEFKGAPGDTLVLYQPEEVKAARVLFMGVGKFEELELESLRTFAGKAVKKVASWDLSDLIFAVPDAQKLGKDGVAIAESLQEGAFLGNHQFEKYKEPKHAPLNRIFFHVPKGKATQLQKTAARVETVCRGSVLAREWVNTAPNDKTPKKLADAIVAAAKKTTLSSEILDERQLRAKKMGAMLAVAAGSESRARLVILDHHPKGAKKTVLLCGKGVTFDTGGINLKPTGSIETMKMDMAGAAAVAGTLISLADLNVKTRVIGVLPIVENMPSGKATRPGDIITAYTGKTVEILNTDAEGRLILIDALAYGIKRYKPDIAIDMATLTGACVMALGEKIAGVFSADDTLAHEIEAAGRHTHERCWRLPLPGDYKELLKSDFADLSNIGSTRWGGAITAALFLSEFVGDTRWAHVDIAGPAYSKKAADYCPAGGTGFGVRLLCDVINRI
jgi:leucyl aminopeptidase